MQIPEIPAPDDPDRHLKYVPETLTYPNGKVALFSLKCVNCGKYPYPHVQEAGYCPKPRTHYPETNCGCLGNTGKPLFPGQIHEPDCKLKGLIESGFLSSLSSLEGITVVERRRERATDDGPFPDDEET